MLHTSIAAWPKTGERNEKKKYNGNSNTDNNNTVAGLDNSGNAIGKAAFKI